MTDEEAREKANEIINAAQSAAGDVGFQEEAEFRKRGKCFCNDDATAYFKKAKKAGCRDLGGAYADHLYNDSNFVQDMIGDRIFEGGKDDNERGRILLALKSMMGTATGWDKAIRNLIDDHHRWVAHAMASGAPIG